MAIKATGQVSIVDLSDGKSLSAYITSNLPKTQIKDPNPGGSIVPSWATTALVLTPVVFANQTALALNAPGLVITWKRKEGSSAETSLVTGENVSAGILTVSANKLDGVASGQITYLAYITYTDPENGLVVNIVAEISFVLIQTALNSKLAWIAGDQAFKYDVSSNVTPAQITLTANLQNVTVQKWQYKNGSGVWTDYPTTGDNANITSATLNVKPTHAVFVGDIATLKILTSEAGVEDIITIYKVRDGATGTAGQNVSTVFLTNENITLAGNKDGQVASVSLGSNVVAYTGTTKVTPVLGSITGAPTGMTVTAGAAVNNEIPLTISITNNATLGGAGVQNGEVSIPITSPVAVTLKLSWSKVNTGATGAAGTNAVVFSIYAPEGAVFTNQEGSKVLQVAAYNGTTPISSGATYVWKKYVAGSWQTIAGQTGSSLTVAGSDVAGLQAYQCIMTYGGQTYTDTITLIDKTDNYQAVISSTGGDVFRNTVGESVLICLVQQNGAFVDDLKTTYISDVAPSSPVSGTFWYKVDKTAKTVTLQKYNGSSWANASGGDLHTMTYRWYRRDKDGNPLDTSTPFKTGKLIFINGADVDVKTTFTCEVE